MTLTAWIKPTVNLTGFTTVIQKQPDAYLLNASNQSGARFPGGGGTTSGGWQYVSGTSASPINAWTHLAVTYDSTILRLYVNGTQVATQPANGTIQTTTSPLWIGGNSPYGEYFVGVLDDVRVYNRALTAAEIPVIRDNATRTPRPRHHPAVHTDRTGGDRERHPGQPDLGRLQRQRRRQPLPSRALPERWLRRVHPDRHTHRDDLHRPRPGREHQLQLPSAGRGLLHQPQRLLDRQHDDNRCRRTRHHQANRPHSSHRDSCRHLADRPQLDRVHGQRRCR